ncbi:MAG: lipoprotein [Betaproteobacteria bacterium]|nr:MAG: lipoprotein [Betaproteobacteria bacterium]
MRYTTLILTLVLIAGCGSKGPLYLPEEEPAETQSAEDANGQDMSEREEDEESMP